MAKEPVRRIRVEWPANDPHRERERWTRDAVAYCYLHRRPVVATLVATLSKYLHATQGHAWASDETLATDIGAKHVSAVERAVRLADELGVIERETTVIHRPDGSVDGRRRRIYPTYPEGMGQALEKARARRSSANRESGSTREYPRPVKGARPTREPTRERLREQTGIINSASKRESPYIPLMASKEGATDLASKIQERLSMIGPGMNEQDLIPCGREVWRALRHNLVSPEDGLLLVELVRDAALRSWCELYPDVINMLGFLDAELTGH
jgi:hypothetical protein